MEKKMIIVMYDDPVLHSFFPPQGKEKLVSLSDETQKVIEAPNLLWVFIRDDEWPEGNQNSRELNQFEKDFFLRTIGLFDIFPTIVVVFNANRKTTFLKYAMAYLLSVDEKDQFDMSIDFFDPKKSSEKNIFLFKEFKDESDISFPFVRYPKKNDSRNRSFWFKDN